MSKTVENQVVAMQFDNRHFESNVKTSLGTLDKLKKSLKLQDAAKGFDNISKSAKKVDLAPIGRSVQTVIPQFSALYTTADHYFRKLLASADRLSAGLASALTIDPIKSGFQEYETQINAVQTILANTQSKGTTLSDVNNALDTLNAYADKTIYNFTEMTRNIGTFTAAGVDLNISVDAIQGIANLAAVSGSNAQQASTAMYQLSQALASGTVKLMDWNSVVNAGMGGQVFQDALKETARVHNVKIDEMIKKQGSFRETLSEGWLTSEILTETLWKFTLATENMTDAEVDAARAKLKQIGYTEEQIEGIFQLGQTATDAATKVKTFTQLLDTLKEAAQSGWTQTWELLIGDFEAAKFLWTGISDAVGGFINKTSESRNAVLGGALQNSGWDKLIKKINEAGVATKDFEESVKAVAEKEGLDVDALIKEYGSLEGAVQAGKISTDMLKKSLDDLKKSGDKFNLDSVKRELKRYSTGEDVKLIEEALKKAGFEPVGKNDGKSYVDEYFGTATVEAVKKFQEAKGLKVTGIVDDATLAALKEATKDTANLTDEVYELINGVTTLGGRENLIEAFKNAWAGMKKVFESVKNAWDKVFPPKSTEEKIEGVVGFINTLKEFTKGLIMNDETASKLTNVFEGFFSILKAVGKLVGGGLKLAFGALSKIFKVVGPIVLEIMSAFGSFFSFLSAKSGEGISAIKNWLVEIYKMPYIQDVINRIKDIFNKFFGPVSEGWKKFTELLKNPFKIDKNGEKQLLSFSEVFDSFKTNVIEKFKAIDFSAVFAKLREAVTNLGSKAKETGEVIATSVKSFPEFLLTVKESFTSKLAEMGIDLEGAGDRITSFFKKIGKFISDNKGIIMAIAGLIGVFIAFKKVAGIIQSLTKPLQFLDDISEAIGGFLSDFGKTMKTQAIKNIAVSIAILAGALTILALLPYGKLWSAVGALTVITAVLVGAFIALSWAAKMLGNVGDLTKVALSIMVLAGALMIFGLAAKKIGELDWGSLLKTGVVLAGFTLALKGIAKSAGASTRSFVGLGSMFIGLAGALLILAGAIMIFGNMDTGTLLKGGGAVIVCIMLMKSVMKATQKLGTVGRHGNFVKVGGIFMAMATALLLIAASVAIFGNMETGTLIKGGIAVIAFMTLMIGVIKATNKIARVGAGGSMVKVGSMFAGMGIALLSIAAAVAIFGNMDVSTLLKGGAAVLVFMGAMVGIMAATKLLATVADGGSFAKVGGTILALSAAILILSASVAILGSLKTSTLAKGVLAVAGIGAVLMGLIAVTQNIPAKSTGTIIALAGAVVVLAGSLIALTFVDPNNLKSAGLALGGVIATLGLLTASTKFISPKAALSVGILTVVVAGLAYIISKLTDIPAEQAVGASIAISILVTSLSASLLLIGKATNNGNIRISGILKMAAALAAIGVVVGTLMAIGVASLPTIGEKLASFFEALMPFLNGVSELDPNIISSIGTLTGAMAALAGASAAFAIADKFTGGLATSSFDVFIGWIKDLLPVVKDFGMELSASGVSINKANLTAVVDSVKTLAEAAASVPNLTVAGGGFGSKWGGGGGGVVSIPLLKSAKDWIVSVVPIVQDLATKVSAKGVKINKTNIDAVVSAAKSLAEAAALAPSVTIAGGGFTSKWVSGGAGVIDWPLLSRAAEWITEVEPVITKLATTISSGTTKNLDPKKLDAICTGAKTLAEAAASVPSHDGAIGIAWGKWGFAVGGAISYTLLNETANWIIKVKDPIIDLADAVSGSKIPKFNGDNLDRIVGAVKTLSEAAASVPTVDGGIITGYNKLFGFFLGAGISHPMISATAGFIKNIEKPITDLATTVSSIDMKPIDIDKFNAIVTAVNTLASADYPTIDGGGLIAKGGWGVAFAAGVSWPLINKIATFITNVKDPITKLANATTTEISEKFNVTNFNAIVKAITDLASCEFPEFKAGGGAAAGAWGVIAGLGWSSPQITEVADFIVAVKDPIIDLANETATGLDTSFNKTNFDSVISAIVDIASAEYPTYTKGNVEVLFGLAKGFGESYSDITKVANFITTVKQPIIDLANATNVENLPNFDAEKFKTIVQAIVDLGSAEYPSIEKFDLDFLSDYSSLKITDEQKTDFDNFVNFIDKVKDPIKTLATSVSGEDVTIDPVKIGAVVDAVKTLADGTNGLPTIGGVKEFIKGKTDFEGFMTFLGELGPSFMTLNDALNNVAIDPAKIGAASSTVKTLAQAASAIPETGAWHDFWSGETNWDEFNANIGKFGEGIAKFSENVAGISVENTSVAALACQQIANAFQYITATNWTIMQDYIGKYAEYVPQLSGAIKSFSDGVSAINVEAVSTASNAVSSSVNALKTLQTITFDTIDTVAFKTKLEQLATATSEFAGSITVDPTAAIANVNSLIDMLTTVSTSNFEEASSFKTALESVATTSIDDFVSKFTGDDATTKVKTAGSDLVKYVGEGMTSNATAIVTAANTVALGGSTTIGSITNYTSYYTAGAYVGAGFVAGINSMLGASTAAGAALGKAALDAAKAALQEHSPSKAFYKVGEFAGMGLVNALYDYERTTYKAGYGVGDSANSGIGDAISKVRSIIENGVDGQPTIRPIMDLSDVSAGIDGMNRMFNMNPAVGVSANVGNIGALVDQVQNGGNSDVIAAINKLGGKISESGRDTYNINGVTYDDGSNITDTVKALVRAVMMEGRV